MTRDEWLAELAVRPITPNQAGAIHREMERLGFTEDDRDDRLAVCAALLGLGSLGSTQDLCQGDGGRLLNMLLHCPDRAALDSLAPRPPESTARPVTVGEVITRIAVLVYVASRDLTGTAAAAR